MNWRSKVATDWGVGNLARRSYPGPPRSYHRVGSTLLHLLVRSAGSELSRSPISLTLFFSPFYFCFLGTSGISLSHNFYCGSIFKSNSLWTSLSPQRLPPQWLEFTRFYNCGCRVSITTFLSSLPSPFTIHQHVPLFPSVICISFLFGHSGTGHQAR